MKSKLILFILIFSIFSIHANSLNSIVKIIVNRQDRNCYAPWQRGNISGASGSGFVLEGGAIITNAHVVKNATTIILKRLDSPRQFSAHVKYVSNECDLAYIVADDKSFYKNINMLKLGDMPDLGDNVIVIGYPAGGEKISFTAGVISRLDYEVYVQDGNAMNFVFQTDAAINPGNSGGPVLMDGKVVGVAFQAQSNLQSVGYFIPFMVLQHFLKDIQDGNYEGFPKLGIAYEDMQNKAAREFYGITDEVGIVITNIAKDSPVTGILKEDDVILKIDNTPVGIDGKITSRWGRINNDFIIKNKFIGEKIKICVLRNKKHINKSIILSTYKKGVRKSHRYNEDYPYLSIAGYVFQPLSRDYLETWGKKWYVLSPSSLKYYYKNFNLSNENRKEIVVLSRILPLEINQGFRHLSYETVNNINGKKVLSLNDMKNILKSVLNNKKESYIVITFDEMNTIPLVIPKDRIKVADKKAFESYLLPVEVR